MDVWVAGRITDATDPNKLAWRLLGVCSTPEGATAMCETERDFIRPFTLGLTVTQQGHRVKEIRFPLRKKQS